MSRRGVAGFGTLIFANQTTRMTSSGGGNVPCRWEGAAIIRAGVARDDDTEPDPAQANPTWNQTRHGVTHSPWVGVQQLSLKPMQTAPGPTLAQSALVVQEPQSDDAGV